MIGSTLAKIADEVIGLQRTEVAEVEEPFHMGKVGSSTMPHKRNPSMCEGVVALARVLQAQVAPALTGMLAYNERDKRGNLAEGAFLAETCCLLSGILATMLRVLDGLQVYPEAMAQNLDRLRGLLLSENVMLTLGRKIGRQHAHEILYEICMRAVEEQAPLKRLLLKDPRVAEHLGETELDELLDPTRYTGLAAEMVDRLTPPPEGSAAPR
jgi:3-carboxy-cis,cis-muconate cycloisomerase